jgi:hypothetical protein
VNVAAENDAPPPALPNVLQLRQRYNANFSKMAPSSLGLPLEFAKIQADPEQNIVWSRPPTADEIIPVVLYHRIMRDFIDDCANHQPVEKDNSLVLELTNSMSRFFQNENVRAAELRDILKDHEIQATTSSILSSDGQPFQTDGAIECGKRLISIIEVKGEIGSKGAEPFAQAILYYHHDASQMSGKPEYLLFNFPCLIVTVFGLTFIYPPLSYNTNVMFSGPHISFSGAVWASRPHFQVLTPTLPLFPHKTDTQMRESLARHFGAFKKALRSLEQCYKAVLKNPPPPPPSPEDLESSLFPDPRTYRSLETDSTVEFKYTDHMDANKLLFIGKTNNGERICIKFVRRYSRAAHEKCATMGIAPKLRGFEGIGAGWTMVIMDALDEEYKTFDKNTLPANTRENIEAGLTKLHQAHYVHGDVRDVNIMVRQDGKPGFMLVDFDWAGIIGEVLYPANVNKRDVERPDDVFDGAPIKSEHDMAMLEYMFR